VPLKWKDLQFCSLVSLLAGIAHLQRALERAAVTGVKLVKHRLDFGLEIVLVMVRHRVVRPRDPLTEVHRALSVQYDLKFSA
jgi:hypothetical protein